MITWVAASNTYGVGHNFAYSSDLLKWTADGRGSARALQLVVSGLIVKPAAILRLRMAARTV